MVVEVQRSPDLPNDGSPRSAMEGEADVTVNTVAAVSPDELGMQHKLSDSWKNAYNTEYPAMAEDGTDAATKTLPNGITNSSNNNSSAGSIVNSLLKKVGGFGDGVSITNGGGSGLEQKIQELRAEKEAAGEMKKCPSSLHNDQDSPLDFSVKRRSSFSGSLTDESQASSSSPGHVTDYNAVSPGADQGPFSHSDDFARRGTPSPDRLDDHNNGSHSSLAAPPVTTMPPLMNGLGVFPGLPSNLMGNGSAINAFSQMAAAAAFMDPRNKKNNNRPFKAYPKEVLQMPLGLFGIPGIQQGMDSGVFAGMNNDDLVSLYNQQLQLLREKQLSATGGKTSPPSQVLTPNGNHSQHQQQHHHHHNQQKQQQQHHPNHRLPSPSPMPHTPTANSMSPSHVTPDHVIPSTTPTPTFPAPGTPASMNSTLVSSTSNSRKRPRSLPDEMKDAAYWERRRKNNDAAKRSRDARRAKEDEIAIRAALLEQENLKLRVEVAALKTETARLRCLLYNN